LKEYNFSNITFRDLREYFKITQSSIYTNYENEWFNYTTKISNEDIEFLQNRVDKVKFFVTSYNETQLMTNFITFILDRVDFNIINKENIEESIRDFWDTNLRYENKKSGLILNGRFDFAIAKGDLYPESPYFFIQEFKKSKEAKDPEPQLLAEMLSAIEINRTNRVRGAFIIGKYWTFVTLHKISNNSYRYYFSKEYNSMELSHLKDIYRLLLFVKEEIKKLAT
jgi:hypothetical protein